MREFKFMEAEDRIIISRDGGGVSENVELEFNGCGVSVLQDKKSSGDGWW